MKECLENNFEESELSTLIDNIQSDCLTKQCYGIIGLRKSVLDGKTYHAK